MFLLIRYGIKGAHNIMGYLQSSATYMAGHFEASEFPMGEMIVRRVTKIRRKEMRGEVSSKGVQTEEKTEKNIAAIYAKRTREPKMSPTENIARRPTAKKLKTRTKGPVTPITKREDRKAQPLPNTMRKKI